MVKYLTIRNLMIEYLMIKNITIGYLTIGSAMIERHTLIDYWIPYLSEQYRMQL